MQNVILASTLHDPKGALDGLIEECTFYLRKQHITGAVITTPETPERIMKKIKLASFECIPSGKSRRETYTAALVYAIKQTGTEQIFMCDFDRVLHWIKKYPEEYARILECGQEYEFSLVGRTSRAFETHPDTQKVTEGTINHYCSKLLGEKILDFGCATFMLRKSIAEKILEKSSADYGIYVEWPVIAHLKTKSFGYFEAEGLEWETPDKFEREIRKKGYAKWLNSFQTHQEWALRNMLMHDCIEAAYAQVSSAKNI